MRVRTQPMSFLADGLLVVALLLAGSVWADMGGGGHDGGGHDGGGHGGGGTKTFACSSRLDEANLNEIVLQGGGAQVVVKYIETKILKSGVGKEGLMLCTSKVTVPGSNICDGGAGPSTSNYDCYYYGEGGMNVGSFTDTSATCDSGLSTFNAEAYLAKVSNFSGNEFEVILLDSRNYDTANAMDYIRICKGNCSGSSVWSVPGIGSGGVPSNNTSACGNQIERNPGSGEFFVARLTDGTGSWLSNQDPGGPTEPTEGTSNTPRGSKKKRIIYMQENH